MLKTEAKITKDFSFQEFACKCGKCSYADGYQVNRNLVNRLQEIRDHIGEPLRVTSGLRCFEHNKNVGGSETSFHLVGRAADIVCTDSVRRYRIVKKALEVGLTVGINKTFIHLDNRGHSKLFLY